VRGVPVPNLSPAPRWYSAAALVRKRVEVATSWFQMTRIYETRDHVENSLARLWIISSSFEERVQIEQLAAHLDEYLRTSYWHRTAPGNQPSKGSFGRANRSYRSPADLSR